MQTNFIEREVMVLVNILNDMIRDSDRKIREVICEVLYFNLENRARVRDDNVEPALASERIHGLLVARFNSCLLASILLPLFILCTMVLVTSSLITALMIIFGMIPIFTGPQLSPLLVPLGCGTSETEPHSQTRTYSGNP